LNQVLTPLWLEQAPLWCFAKLYVPSLHCAVAFAGAPAGGACVGADSACGVGRSVAVGALGDSAGAGADLGAGAGVSPASHVATPPCLEQAPCLDFAVLYVPSLHCAVALVGA